MTVDNDLSNLSAQLHTINDALAEIRAMLKELEKRLRELERSDAGTHPILQSRIDAAWRRLDEYHERIRSTEEQITAQREANKLLAWIGGILGSTVIVWLVSQILGKVP